MKTRNTLQKKLIYNGVKMLSHPTADQIYQHVKQLHPIISKGTVYRNLISLVQSKKIVQIKMPTGADCFDHILEDHYHFQCKKCGQLFDIPIFIKNELIHHLGTKGFCVEEMNVLLTGLCPKCQCQDERKKQ